MSSFPDDTYLFSSLCSSYLKDGRANRGNLVTQRGNLVAQRGNLVTQRGNLVTQLGSLVTQLCLFVQ